MSNTRPPVVKYDVIGETDRLAKNVYELRALQVITPTVARKALKTIQSIRNRNLYRQIGTSS